MEDTYFEVNFNKYCDLCKYKEKTGDEEPCYHCLAEPMNLNSKKPVKYKEKE